ncbi:MAG: hypothetical protein ACRDYC_13945, partial [Acidimicrobiales bacterium]
MPSYWYSRWDGSQDEADLDAAQAFDSLTDDLLYHGDLNQALRRLLQEGMRDQEGRRVAGLREMLQRLRQARQEMLADNQLGSAYENLAERLREIVAAERAALEELVESAGADQARREAAAQTAAERGLHLDLLPPDLAGQVGELQSYDWTSPWAAQRFQELLEEMRRDLVGGRFEGMREAMANPSPEALARLREMLAELNRLLEMRAAGREDPAEFERFMERFGDLVPGSPRTLDELLENLARQMASAAQLLNSMSPEQRAELQALS